MKAHNARMRLLGVELDLFKYREATNSDTKVVICKIVDAKGDSNKTVTCQHQNTAIFYNSICQSVDRALIKFSRQLKKTFDCQKRSLQENVGDAVSGAAEETSEPFIFCSRCDWEEVES